jgi:hypothetical protein
MPSPSAVRHCVVALGATACLLSASVVAVVMGTAGAANSVQVAAVTPIAPEPSTTSTTVAPSTTTSSTSTSTSTTSTTVKPRPATTVAPVRTTSPPVTAPPTTKAAPAPAPAPASTAPGDRCRAALQFAGDHGVLLPAGWGFRCPGEALVNGSDHWGVACFNCEGTGSWIAVDIGRIGSSDAALRYVVTHETCHAIDYTTLGVTTELGADLCAALHGAPRPAGTGSA